MVFLIIFLFQHAIKRGFVLQYTLPLTSHRKFFSVSVKTLTHHYFLYPLIGLPNNVGLKSDRSAVTLHRNMDFGFPPDPLVLICTHTLYIDIYLYIVLTKMLSYQSLMSGLLNNTRCCVRDATLSLLDIWARVVLMAFYTILHSYCAMPLPMLRMCLTQ